MGNICSISGSFSGGGETSSTRKRYSRMVKYVHTRQYGFDHPNITFSPKDFEGVCPHEDESIVVLLRGCAPMSEFYLMRASRRMSNMGIHLKI